MQDASLQESMGPIVDRTKENLVSTDNGIIMARHRLMRAAKALRREGHGPARRRCRAPARALGRGRAAAGSSVQGRRKGAAQGSRGCRAGFGLIAALRGGRSRARMEVQMGKRPAVIVAGGGIGGLSTALGLANKGCNVTVLEQADRFGEIGAGIQIGPNAFHAMDYLGVGDAGRAKAVYIDRLIMMDGMTGAEIAEIPVDEPFRRRFGNPYAVIHRSDLHGVLLDACRANSSITLVNKQRVIGYEHAANGAKVRTEAGAVFEADAVVGCDGVRSKIREQLTGGDPLRLVRPRRLSGGAADRADARGSALERRHALGRPEVPHGALSAAGLEDLQPGRDIPDRGGERRCQRAGKPRGNPLALRSHRPQGAQAPGNSDRMAPLGAWRPRADRELDRGPGDASGRRRASHPPVFCARRLHGDGGRGLPGRPVRAVAGQFHAAPSWPTRRTASFAPIASCCRRGCWGACITPKAWNGKSATPCSAPNRQVNSTTACNGSMAGPDWPPDENTSREI